MSFLVIHKVKTVEWSESYIILYLFIKTSRLPFITHFFFFLICVSLIICVSLGNNKYWVGQDLHTIFCASFYCISLYLYVWFLFYLRWISMRMDNDLSWINYTKASTSVTKNYLVNTMGGYIKICPLGN